MTARALFLALLALLPAAGWGARLDDSLSPRQRVEVTSRWLHDGPGDWTEDQLNAMVAEVRAMEFRLKTAAYVGRNAEIYLTVPRVPLGLRIPTAMRLEWTARGRFASGSLVPGDRALLYRGKITESVTTEIFDFRIYYDARSAERGIEFDPVFEIEVVNP